MGNDQTGADAGGEGGVRRSEIFGWCCFDFANSAFTTIVITVVGLPYFRGVIAQGDVRAEGWWGTALALAQLIVMVLAPMVGVFADVKAAKKRLLLAAAVICAAATAGLFWTGAGVVWPALGLLVLANVAFSMSETVCAAFLPEISTPENVGRISGYGWAFGYLGGLLSLVLALVIVFAGEKHVRWTFPMTAGFFVLASVPTLVLLRERGRPRVLSAGETWAGLAWGQLAAMRRELPKHRLLLRFFVAMTVYLAGLSAVVAFAAGYATEVIGMTSKGVIALFAVLQLAGVAGAYGFGRLQDRIGAKVPLLLSLALWLVVCVWAARCRSEAEFYVIGVLAGIGMGSLQSSSRAVVAGFTPQDRAGEFFGYWGFFSKLAGVIGPFVFGWFATHLGYRHAIMVNGVLFIAGFVLLLSLKIQKVKTD